MSKVVFTADHEEPCCAWCDFQDTCDGIKVQCGPKYGWSKYRRTEEDYNITTDEETLLKLIRENYHGK